MKFSSSREREVYGEQIVNLKNQIPRTPWLCKRLGCYSYSAYPLWFKVFKRFSNLCSSVFICGSFFSLAVFICGPLSASHDEPRAIEDEIIYFVMPDRFANGDPSNDRGDNRGDNRGGIDGRRLQHGFDPTHKGFYHGGDLKGLTAKLDYIQGLGATAIWLTPVFVNKPVQGPAGDESAGYHGYWILDFSDIDPHLGTREDYRALVEAAHARGMKVIMDIVVNHTADVNQYRECADYNPQADIWWSECEYRSITDYPWITRGGPDGKAINAGFSGDAAEHRTTKNFALLKSPDWTYEVFIPERERHARTPTWLNDPLVYHNRGNSHWQGESSLYGDFSGLDDVFTEDPRVVTGMLDIYTGWIRDFRIDGFRVDTAKHVNDGFWREFNPIILKTARERGIADFYLFGEAYETSPEALAKHTRDAAWPAVLDFAFAHTAKDVITGKAAPAALAEVFARDALYQSDPRGANILPTFIGNHDDGRIGHFLLEALGTDTGDDELLARSILGHALLMFSRGVPVIYYGDEQGFTGDGRDQDAREDMFESRVGVYNDNRLIGTDATTAEDNFDSHHPIYQAIARMSHVRATEHALRRGTQSVLRADPEPGILVFTRSLDQTRLLVVFNTANAPGEATVRTEAGHAEVQTVYQRGLDGFASQDGQITIKLAPLSFAVLKTPVALTVLENRE